MLKKICYLILIFTICQKALPQSNWVLQNSGVTLDLYCVQFLDQNTGWVAGGNGYQTGALIKTTNGGTNWFSSLDIINRSLVKLQFIDANTGWALGSDTGSIFKTINGGQNWTLIHTDTISYISCYFKNSTTGWVCGHRSKIEKTTDGGATWALEPVGLNVGYDLTCIYFYDFNTGWCLGTFGAMLRTTNGGASWILTSRPTGEAYRSISFIDANTGFAAGGLSTYSNSPSPTGRGIVLKTTDGGINWIKIYTLETPHTFDIQGFKTIQFIDANTGWVGGSPAENGMNGVLLKSTDGGFNWAQADIGNIRNVYGLSFVNNLTGWAVSSNGNIIKTTNGGGPVTYAITGSVRYQDNNQLVVKGYVKAVKYDHVSNQIVTLDSSQIQPNGAYSLINIHHDTLDIMAFDDDETTMPKFVPTFYVSTIYWQNASMLYPSSNLDSINVKVIRANNIQGPLHIRGYVYGSSDVLNGLKDARVYAASANVYKEYSISAGSGSFQIDSLVAGTYNLTIDRMGYAPAYRTVTLTNEGVDTISIILNKVPDEITRTGTTVPKSFWLGNNYPNPFNPSTKIRFGLPNASMTSITVYDVLGRIVSRLLNERLSAGEYTIEWNASEMPSGVYFYRLETENFTAAKKLILIK